MPLPGGTQRNGPEGASSARIHNYLAGGGNWGVADEAAARELLAVVPQVRRIAEGSRLFAGRAAVYAAGQGIRQVIDLGCGVPRRAGEGLHQIAAAQAGEPVRGVYADLDEIALGETGALLGDGRDSAALVCADLRDPGAVLGDPAVKAAGVDLGEPVLLLAGLVLHFQPPAEAAQVVAGYAGLVAAGSLVAVSVPVFPDPAVLAAIQEMYAPEVVHGYALEDVAGLLAGLGRVPPGVAAASRLRPGWEDVPAAPPPGVYLAGGIGRKL